MENSKEISAHTLRNWLETGRKVSVMDIRPLQERSEWFIPGSIHLNAYEKLKINAVDALAGLHLDKSIPVVAVCAGGKTSMIAAELLQKDGYEAYSLQAGMKGWSLSWNTATIVFKDSKIIQVRRTGKGCLSYIIISKNEAIVVDASLPIAVYQEILQKEKSRVKYVMETHIHADHLSRSRELAEANNVTLHLPFPNKVGFDFEPIGEETTFQIGNISIKAMHTPGHTLESTSYLIEDTVLLTGDTLFINSVGRPDLKANTDEATLRAGLLYSSLQRIMLFADSIMVLPGHTSQPVDFDNTPIQTTIGDIRNNVPLLALAESEFVTTILQRIPPTPANYLSIVEKNNLGDFSDINPIDLEAGANRCAIS